MFDMITWICQHKFENTSTVKMPITMSGKSKINWNWGEVHIEGVYLYLSKKKIPDACKNWKIPQIYNK